VIQWKFVDDLNQLRNDMPRELGPAAGEITAGPRVGVAYADEDATLPYRFRVPAAQYAAGR